ncbi:MAG TPA: arginase family protein [Polyangia bacterium]|nr:arginase family protein [Polyangia bacterium]
MTDAPPASDVDELALMLRPAGGGIFTVSTGRAEQEALQRTLYGAVDSAAVDSAWRASLSAIATAKAVVLGIPSDCGAGLIRGAAYGPQGVRAAALRLRPDFPQMSRRLGIVDVGDVFVVPQLLSDEMLDAGQVQATRAAIYDGDPRAARLPVAPLSIAEAVVDRILRINPGVRLLMLGGDHSVAWPVVAALARHVREPWAIVHLDAHTDLLPQRLGIKICFATWAYHANELLGRGGRLVQVGVRASGRPRAHWETTLGVRQFWMDDIRARGEQAIVDELLAHLRASGARRVYLSNDIDATDAALAPSTGAPADGGLSVAFVRSLISRLGGAVSLLGGDVVEVAPPVGSPADAQRTTDVAACYMLETLAVLVGDSALRPQGKAQAQMSDHA